MWTLGALEMALFSLHSPVHALLWIVTTRANCMFMFFVMFIVGVQVRVLRLLLPLLLQCGCVS